MDEDVGSAREPLHNFAATRVIEVGTDTFLVAIVGKVNGGFAVPERGEAAAVVATGGAFDFDYGRAEVAEQLRAVRPSDVLREIDDGQSIEYCGHRVTIAEAVFVYRILACRILAYRILRANDAARGALDGSHARQLEI